MASPQLENGYTRIANELVEALAGIRLSGREFQVVMAVVRLTYGFHKRDDSISFTASASAIEIIQVFDVETGEDVTDQYR